MVMNTTTNRQIRTFAGIAGLVLLLILIGVQPVLAKTYEYGGHRFTAGEALPNWVLNLDVPLNKYRQRPRQADSVRYILHDRQRSVVGRNTVSYFRIAMQPWSQDGLEDSSQLTFDFSPAYQKLNIYWIKVYRKGKLIRRFDPDKVKIIQQEKDIEIRLYDGRVTALVVLEDVRLGDVIDYAYSIDGHNPVMGDVYSARHRMAWGTPVDRMHLRLNIEKNRRLKIKYKDIKQKPVDKVNNGIRSYTWDFYNVAALSHDGQTPDGFDPYPRIYISEYKNWRGVKRWAEKLYVYNKTFSPALRKRVDGWKKLPTKEAQARAALAFVQQEIRYFGVEMGQNSHRPSEPNEVVERLYGDCKDKAMLLVAILRDMGMDAWPALVSVDHNIGVKDWLPTPKAFDHVIVMMKYKGETYWLDGTRGYQKGRLARIGVPAFGYALVIGKGGEFTPIKFGKENRPFIDVQEKFTVKNYNGAIEMEVISKYHTSRAEKQRKYFLNNAHDRIQEEFLNYYARRHPAIRVNKPMTVIDHEDDNIIEVHEYYLVDNYLEPEKDKLYATLRGTTLGSWLSFPDKVKRSMPLGINHPFKIRHVSSISYPEDIAFDIHNDTEEVKAPGFKFRRVADYQPNTLSVQFDVESTEFAVAAKDIDHYLKQIRAARNELAYSIWVREPEWMTFKRLAKETDPMVDELVKRLTRKR